MTGGKPILGTPLSRCDSGNCNRTVVIQATFDLMRPIRQVSHVEGRRLHRIAKVGLSRKPVEVVQGFGFGEQFETDWNSLWL